MASRPFCIGQLLVASSGPTWGSTATRCRRELQGIAQASGQLPFDCLAVTVETQVASRGDNTSVVAKQLGRERERLAYADGELGVQLAREREMKERAVRDPARHAPSLADHVRN